MKNRHIGRCVLLGLLLAAAGLCAACRKAPQAWRFTVYGVSTAPDKVSCTGGYDEGRLTIACAGSGKMVAYGADGLSFYYTALDGSRDNFVLSATVVVDSWTMTNGEDDGFGLMVCDAAADSGDGADFWNNCYMAAVTKVEYEWDPVRGEVSNVGDHIIMRQGVAAREKIGSTAARTANAMEAAAAQTVTSCTLESSMGGKGPGTYNIIGGYTPIPVPGGGERAPAGTAAGDALLTKLRLEICRDNTGYRIRYIEQDGTVHEKLFYDDERTNLTAIDKEHIYVGFFVTGKACITFQDMALTVTSASKDPAAQQRLPAVVAPDYRVTSSAAANRADHQLVFSTNYAGLLTVKDAQGRTVAADVALQAQQSVSLSCTLHPGDNLYQITFAPQLQADAPVVLSDPSTAVFDHCVTYRRIGDAQGNIYTAPGCAGGDGTQAAPIPLSEAVKYAAPGQTILLAEGVYTLSEPLAIERGHDGTDAAPIALVSAPGNRSRPVLDFQGQSAGVILSADHWYLYGFDCTGSASGAYGIHLTGSFNTLERLEIYRNGNTGLHISSLSMWDDRAQWPSYNTVLNCTSYANADDAYEDADGFACQFTAGPGNVFDGCIAHHNADDGWDLYAKVWLQPLGPVQIQNCIAYQNGYLEDGQAAGNGNGFKLGGDGMPGGHVVENCLAFENRTDGFNANGCPDITLRGCTAIDNRGRNICLYTRNQSDTAYLVQNTCSVRTQAAHGTADVLQGLGTQPQQDMYNETAYYWDPDAGAACNSRGAQVTAQALYVSTEFTPGYSIARDAAGRIVLCGAFLCRAQDESVGAQFERGA